MAAIDFYPKFLSQGPTYVPVNMSLIKDRLIAKNQAAILKSGIKQDAIDIEQFAKKMGSEEFMLRYTEVLTEMLQSISKESDGIIPENFFDIDGKSSISMTELKPTDLAQHLDEVIATLRSSIKIAFPSNTFAPLHNLITITDNQQFLDNFASVVGQYANSPEWANIGALHGHIKGLAATYAELKSGADPGPVLKKFNSNLKNTWGQVIWENIALAARVKVIEEIMKEIGQDIILPTQHAWIGDISIRIRGKQVGAEKSSNNKQEVADSIITIEILNSENAVIATITTGDSTKFKQNAQTGGVHFHDTTAQEAIHSLGDLLNSVHQRTYWEERLRIFLDGSPNKAKRATKKPKDIEHWQNTYEGFYRLALWDTMAVRATTSAQKAQTLTINNKIKLISSIIIDIKTEDINARAIKNKNNIFQLGDKYSKYVTKQLKTSSGSSDNDEDKLWSNYSSYINSVLSTKISISRNVSYAAISGNI